MKHPLFLFCAVMLLAGPAFAACRCRAPDVRSAYANADAVALVRIRAVDQKGHHRHVARAEAEVLEAWKSELPESIAIFSTETCDYPLRRGDFLLYLTHGHAGDWTTSSCSGNLYKADAAARIKWLKQHGKSFTHRHPEPPRHVPSPRHPRRH